MMYRRRRMHRTQIYFDEPLFSEIKAHANALGISLSAYIRDALKRDLEQKRTKPQKSDFQRFAGMWSERDITQESIRKDAWK